MDLEVEQRINSIRLEYEKKIATLRKALDPANEPTFVQLWITENQENELLQSVLREARRFICKDYKICKRPMCAAIARYDER